MNRCRMTLRILVTLFAAIALLTSVAEAKQASVNAPTTLNGNTPGQPNLQLKQAETGGPVIQIGEEEVVLRYQDEASKSAPIRPEGQPLKASPATSFILEEFATAVPPAGWSETIFDAAYNWKYTTATSYSGGSCADVEYDPTLPPPTQDEWLITPVLNFTGATADLKVEFYWMMSYYWGVSPFDNYDLELYISTDGGATFPTLLWDETSAGLFVNWTWTKTTIDLSGYAGQTNVKLAWRYYGSDGAQAGLDLVSVNDNAAPIGRCCYGGGSCADVTEAACGTLGGDWDGGLDCTTACPVATPGDNCSDPYVVNLPAQLPYTDANQYTCGRIDDYNATCLGSYDGGEDMVYFIKVTAAVTVNITLNPKGTTYTGMAIDLPTACPLDAATGSCIATSTNSGSTAHSILNLALAPGDYYLMVDTWPAPDCIPDFDLTIIESPPMPDGANCADPLVVTIGAGSLPLTVSGLSNCGFGNDYSTTCMGSYDGGEDHITQLVLTEPLLLDITLNPNGTTWSGFAIDNVCPLDAATGSCIGYIGTSSGTAKTLYGLNLAAGTYYIMVDTYPSPNCIPNFSLSFAGAAPPPPNDNCASATPVGDVLNLPFDNTAAGHDGTGTCSTAGKNLWYCFTAPMTGNARISLCGSSFDTKLAVYDGCACTPLGTQLACEDDNCGLQSEAIVPVVMGQQYKIEVTGYSATSFGAGFLTIETTVPPANDNCEDVTPVVLTDGVPVTFTGDNTGASPDCASFAGPNVWEAFTISTCSDVTLDYCGTSPAFGNAWLNLALGCPCASFTTGATFDVSTCGDGNVTMTWAALPAGTYYYPVMNDPSNDAVGPYTINVVANPVVAYCAGSGGCDEFISNVTLADLNNSSSCAGYSDYTSMSAGLVQTVPYTITVTNGVPYTGDQCGVWVDWDGDLCFSPSEQVLMSGGPTSFTGTVTAPLTAAVGPTRMRVRIAYTGALPACGTTSYGEVEDYTIDVIAYAPTAKVDPYTQYQYQRFAVTPIIDVFHFGMFNGGYTANDVNLSTVKINALFTPTSISVVPSAPGFAGPVVRAELPLPTFLGWWFYVNNYLYDVNNANFAVMGKFNDNVNFSIIGDVVIVGKSSVVPSTYILPDGDEVVLPGDFNIDGALTVSDAVGIINYIFAGASAPANVMILDTDCSRGITVSDAVYMINFIFGGGPAPCVASN